MRFSGHHLLAWLTSLMKSISNTPPTQSIAADASSLRIAEQQDEELVSVAFGWNTMSGTQKARVCKPKSTQKRFDLLPWKLYCDGPKWQS